MWRIGIAVLLGQCCLHALPSLPAAWPFAVLLAGCIAGAIFLRTYFVIGVLLGFGWAWSHAQTHLDQDLPAHLEGRDLIVTGRIASMLDARDVDPQFEFDIEHAHAGVPRKIRLGWYDGDLRPQPGELWRLVVRLKRRNGFANPGGFDYEGFLFRSGIGATGYIRNDDRNTKLAGAGGRYAVLRARAWIGARIAGAVGDTPMLGVLQGLAVGDTQAMSAQQWRVFAATGTTHLMAISGLHISMIAAIAALGGGQIVRWKRAQALRIVAAHGQALAGIAAAITYSLLAGMSVPTQRTLTMLCIFFAVRAWRRELNIANALGAALLGVLILDPFAPLAVGAWLSFGAVAAILMATAGRIGREHTLVNFARVQWAVTLGLLPVLVVAFGSQSLISPIANALAVPLFSLLIVPLVLMGSVLAALWLPAGTLVLGIATKLLTWCWPALSWLAERSWALWHFPELPPMNSALLACASLLLVLPSVWPTRLAAIALCVPALMFRPAVPAQGDVEVTILDVGQGLASVVRTRAHTLVFDAGPAFRTGRDTGELVVVPYLRARGIRQLDRLVISHGDLDHQGGMKSVDRDIRTTELLVGPSVHDVPREAEHCMAGQHWEWDGVRFEVLHPTEKIAESDNDTSCVLSIVGRAGAALLTGDIEASAELALVNRGLRSHDIVVVAHHGSRSSSTEEFVTATRAKWALVSAGYRNRWGFPKRDVTERWQRAGATVRSTIESGALEIAITQNNGIRVQEFRRARPKYWYSR